MRKLALTLLIAGAFTFAVVPSALSGPAPQSPVGGFGAHPHHVHTGNGGCVDIDSVLFEPSTRGLHRGSNASGGPARGPFHGSCGDPHPHMPPGGH